MFRKNIKHYIVFVVVFFSWVNFANASISINEIQLSPTVERFIELYNSGSSPVDLTNWYIQRKTASGSTFGSLVSKTYFEGLSIEANGYLLISRTSVNNPDIIVDNLTLTESNIIQIKNQDQEVVDSFEWGSISEDKSTQKNSDGDWEEFLPTPGEENQSTTINEILVIDNSNNVSNSSVYLAPQKSVPRKINSKIITPKIVFAGIPFLLEPSITTNKKEILTSGKFKWNFGDGTATNLSSSKSFEHTYFYSGEYLISLNYTEQYNSKLNTSTRFTIKVVPSEMIINSIGSGGDAFIELENKSKYEMILSNWIITAGLRSFVVPEGTVILARKKLKLSPKITGFTQNDLNIIIMTDSKGEVMTMFPVQKAKTSTQKVSTKNTYKKPLSVKEDKLEESPLIIDLNDLGASVGNLKKDIPVNIYAYWGLGLIIIIGISSILLFRRKNPDDYLEDEIRAEDMTIIE